MIRRALLFLTILLGSTSINAVHSEESGSAPLQPADGPVQKSSQEAPPKEAVQETQQSQSSAASQESKPAIQAQSFLDGPFSAIVPGKPVRQKANVEGILRPMTSYSYTDGKNGTYELSYLDVGNWPGTRTSIRQDPENLYEFLEIMAARARKATAKDGPVEYAGHPGRQYELAYSSPKDPKKRLVDKKIVFLVGSRLYRVGCEGDPAWVDSSPDVLKFMRSFKVIQPSDSRSADELTEFKWSAVTQTRDVTALAKRIDDFLYSKAVPPVSYMDPYPYKVQLISHEEGRTDNTTFYFSSFSFVTRASAANTISWYTDKLRANNWQMARLPSGLIKAGRFFNPNRDQRLNFNLHVYEFEVACYPEPFGTQVRLTWRYDKSGHGTTKSRDFMQSASRRRQLVP